MDPSAMQSSAGTEASESALALLTDHGHGDASLSANIVVHHSSGAHATRPFTVTRTNQVSYADMYGRVNRIADVLLELGVVAGDSVGIFMPNCAPHCVRRTAVRVCP
jgi:acyl-coenzyme A synthetase/AMP-(fatty) acid ligase